MPHCDMIDLSHLNSPLDFHDLKAKGVIALANKATQGSTFKDPSFTVNMARALEVGWIRLAYHFVDSSPAKSQWVNFKESLSGVGKVYLVLDIETNPEDGTNPSLEIVNAMITEIVADTGRHPMLYGSNVLESMTAPTACPLWIAKYSSQPPTWGGPWTFLWQYSESGDGDQGIPAGVDCSQWMGKGLTFNGWYEAKVITL